VFVFLKDNYRKISWIFCLPTKAFMTVIRLRIAKLALRHYRPVHKKCVCSPTHKKLWPIRTKMTRRVKPSAIHKLQKWKTNYKNIEHIIIIKICHRAFSSKVFMKITLAVKLVIRNALMSSAI